VTGGNGSWEQFTEGNTAAETHGAYSERRISKLAEQYEAELLADPTTPDWVRLPRYAGARAARNRNKAVVQILVDWLDSQDIETVLTDKTITEEVEKREKGRTARRSTSTRVISVLDQLHRAETRLASSNRDLGLTPASEAALTKNLAQSGWYRSVSTSPLDQALEEKARQRALGAGEHGAE
jgi:hypothetical protein